MREVVGHPNGLRAEAGASTVGGAAIERCPQDHDIGIRIAGLVVKIAFRHAEKREIRAKLGAVASHCSRCSCGRMACADSWMMVSPRKNSGWRARMINMTTTPSKINPRPRISTSPTPPILAPLP